MRTAECAGSAAIVHWRMIYLAEVDPSGEAHGVHELWRVNT